MVHKATKKQICQILISFFFILSLGRKGIGFKSVFTVSDSPEVHSNGFHVRFRREHSSDSSRASILAPEWISPETGLTLEEEGRWKTFIKLPLSPTTCGASATPEAVIGFARQLLTNHLILFLRRIDCISFQTSAVGLFKYFDYSTTSRTYPFVWTYDWSGV